VKVISSDSSVTPDTVITQQDGSAVIKFKPKQTPKTSLQILAFAEGYSEEQKTFDFDVQPSLEEKKTEIPQWVIYAGVGIVAAIAAGMIFVLRKPKKTLEDEEDIYE
jgi:rhamnose utilization protein RhaD (predicted bifunctional aldolase and dehydrogenase)